jgi:TolB-like protein/Flp pilus assembly protein TadD
MSGDPDKEFFSDGVTEDILTHLTRVKGLRVTSRTSVMRYKGTTKTLPEVAKELGVDSVLEGSIRVAGGKVRVTVQLIDASADDHLWAESYDRSLEDVFAVQSEVAEAVARALQAELSAGEIKEIRARPTDNVEAYTLCLRGQEALKTWAPADLERAVEHFEAALRLDLNYARAYAGLAMVLAVMPALSARAPADFHRRVEQAATRALELDDGLPLAHAARATLLWTRDYDWRGAWLAMDRAVALAPRDAFVRQMQGVMLVAEGRFDESFAVVDEVEPGEAKRLLGATMQAWSRYNQYRFEEAHALLDALLRDSPDYFLLHFHRSVAFSYAGRNAEALVAIDRAIAIDPDVPIAVAVRARVLAALDRTEEARSEVARLVEWKGDYPVTGYPMGLAYVSIGELERALDCWEAAVAERDFFAPFLRSVPRYRPLRANPRFQAILRSMWPEHGPFQA